MQTQKAREENIIHFYDERKGEYVNIDVNAIASAMREHMMGFEEFYEIMDKVIEHINLHLLTEQTELTMDTRNMLFYLYVVRNMFLKMQVNKQ